MKKIISAHKFFVRKSQHYIMGNWNEYENWWKDPNDFKDFNYNKLKYYIGFIPAYIRFMWMYLK